MYIERVIDERKTYKESDMKGERDKERHERE